MPLKVKKRHQVDFELRLFCSLNLIILYVTYVAFICYIVILIVEKYSHRYWFQTDCPVLWKININIFQRQIWFQLKSEASRSTVLSLLLLLVFEQSRQRDLPLPEVIKVGSLHGSVLTLPQQAWNRELPPHLHQLLWSSESIRWCCTSTELQNKSRGLLMFSVYHWCTDIITSNSMWKRFCHAYKYIYKLKKYRILAEYGAITDPNKDQLFKGHSNRVDAKGTKLNSVSKFIHTWESLLILIIIFCYWIHLAHFLLTSLNPGHNIARGLQADNIHVCGSLLPQMIHNNTKMHCNNILVQSLLQSFGGGTSFVFRSRFKEESGTCHSPRWCSMVF